MSESAPTVHFRRDGNPAIVTLDNPPMNQIGEELIGDLIGAIEQVEAADGLRMLLLNGNGDVFSAGADVRLFVGRGADEMRPLIASFLELAAGPTLAFAAAKDIARAYSQNGVVAADARLLDVAVGLFDTADAREGIRSSLESGPGHATYAGN